MNPVIRIPILPWYNVYKKCECIEWFKVTKCFEILPWQSEEPYPFMRGGYISIYIFYLKNVGYIDISKKAFPEKVKTPGKLRQRWCKLQKGEECLRRKCGEYLQTARGAGVWRWVGPVQPYFCLPNHSLAKAHLISLYQVVLISFDDGFNLNWMV